MSGAIRNPKYAAPSARPNLTVAEQTQLRTALQTAISGNTSGEEYLSVHELVVAARTALSAVNREKINGAEVRAALEQLGHKIER